MRYLLDTNICIYIVKRKPAQVRQRFSRIAMGDVGMSVITYLELVFGAWKSQRFEASLAIVEELREEIPVQTIGAEVASQYGRVRADLESSGTPMGALDIVIAAHALTLGLILVTNNTREFSRVKGLKLENWAE